MTSLDCRWLSAGGYIAPLPDGLRGRRISADPWLDEKMFVMLTDSGEMLLALLENAKETLTTSRDPVDCQRLGGPQRRPDDPLRQSDQRTFSR
ncbi:MAG TPA: hypothetical protein VG826_05980 [Pirellulales bacterium]|nr:hypothetical protein [Pirellulales bacterium]